MKIKHQILKYFLYVRRSQDAEDRQVASLDDQITEMKRLAERMGIEIVAIIQESMSAKKPGRPQFNKMIERIHAGEANGILCWKLNRLARNPIDGGQISWLLQTGVICSIQTYEREYLPTDNVIIMAVELGMANQFVKDLSVDVRRGMRQKAERGWMPQSWLPIGYTHNTGYEKGEPEIVSNRDLKIVKKLFSLFLEGTYSVSDIERKAKVLGLRRKKTGKPYCNNTFVNMLRNPMYMGYFDWVNENNERVLVKGGHEAILTEEQYRRVQLLLGKRGRPTRINKYDFPFRGPFTCGECGHDITAEHKLQCICTGCKFKFSVKNASECPKCHLDIEEMDDPTFLDKTYYRCTKKSKTHKCLSKGMEEADLALAIDEALLGIEIDENYYSWAKLALQEVHKEEASSQREVHRRVSNRKKELLEQADELVRMRSKKEISTERYLKTQTELDAELTALDKEGAGLSERAIHWVEIADGYLTFVETASKLFKETNDIQLKRELVLTLGSNLTITDKKAFITLGKALQSVKKTHSASHKVLGQFEPKKALDKQGLSQEKAMAFSTLCAGVDSNHRRPKPTDLQSVVIDHSTTDASIRFG